MAPEFDLFLSTPSIGRRPTTLVCLLIQGAFGIGTAFAPNFYVYVALRWAIGAALSGVAIGTLALGKIPSLLGGLAPRNAWPYGKQWKRPHG